MSTVRGRPSRAALALNASLFALMLGALLWSANELHAEGEVNLAIVSIDDRAFPVISVTFTADVAGRPLTGLRPDAVSVVEGEDAGSQGRVISLASKFDDEAPLALTLAIDVSGSMLGEPLEGAKDAAAVLVESLRDGDTGAIVTFASDVQWVQRHTSDRALLINALEGLTAVGYTALYDAVGEATSGQPANHSIRSAVVLLSDGRDDGDFSQRSREGAIAAAAAGRAMFFTIGFGDDVDAAFLEEVALASGGQFFLAASVEEVAEVYASIEALLRKSFVLTFATSAPASATERTLSIVLDTAEGSGQAVRTYTGSHAASAPVVTTPALAPPPAPAVTPSATPESGGQWIPFVLGTGLVATVAAGFVLFSVRRKSRQPAPMIAADQRPLPTNVHGIAASARGGLTIGLPGQAVEITNRPITIGTSPGCELRVPDAPGIASEHARVWMRDGRAMLHHLARSGTTEVNGAPSEWAALVAGDVVGIGPWELRVMLPQDASPIGETSAPGSPAAGR